MPNSRKQVAFDLDTDALKIYYPTKNWNNAYYDIRREMERNGFAWQQGSVYNTIRPLPPIIVPKMLSSLVQKHPWLNICMRDCIISNIGREHGQNHLFDRALKIPTREEVIKSHVNTERKN